MRACIALVLMLPLAAGAQLFGKEESGGARERRAEAQVTLPQFPKAENYLPFQVSATTPFDFFIDAKSVSIGADGVVRYTVIGKSSGGALNVSFEGMRCAEREFRIYAFGRSGNTWSEVRESRWEPIRTDTRNAQRAVLYNDFFCPATISIATTEAALHALRNGGGDPQNRLRAY